MRANGPGQSSLVLLDLIPLLDKRDISYAVIGAFAASFYGIVRASLDADAVISVDSNEVNNLISDFEELGLKAKYNRGDHEDPVLGIINIEDQFCNRVDFFLGIRGLDKDAFQRAINVDFMDSSIKVIAVEDLIAMKIFAGGPKDMMDVQGILEVSSGNINLTLLKELALKFGHDVLKKLEELLENNS